jgi:hypothetical protein
VKHFFHKISFVLFLIQLINVNDLKAQTIDYSLQANIIYRLTKYIDWKAVNKTDDFIIGVDGNEEAYKALTTATKNKFANEQKIKVRLIDNIKNVNDCNILFITDEASDDLKLLFQSTQNKPILIVTEKKGMALKGSCINFIVVDDKLKLEVNKTNIEDRNLKISKELLKLTILVNN